MEKTIKYIGLDVHKNSIAIAIADQGQNQEVRFYGTILNRLDLLDKFTRDRITQQIQNLTKTWRMASVVKALQAMRGVPTIVATTTVAELGDLGRFDHPQQLMAYLGLVPSEHSSGEKVKRGAITKTGNGHVRRVLVEAAQTYRLPARISRVLLKRQEGLSQVSGRGAITVRRILVNPMGIDLNRNSRVQTEVAPRRSQVWR